MQTNTRGFEKVLSTPAVWHPTAPRDAYAHVLFRRRFSLSRARRGVVLWITASQRFILYLDGKQIARGPSRGSPDRWRVTRVRIPELRKGRHVLAVRCVHFGRYGGKGQLGGDAFFLLHVATPELQEALDTGSAQWRCFHDVSISPAVGKAGGKVRGHSAVGSGEEVRAEKAPRGWEQAGFRDGDWQDAHIVAREPLDDWGNRPLKHALVPDELPQMEEKTVRLIERRSVPAGASADRTVPARSTRTLLLDAGVLTSAYPRLHIAGGRKARVEVVYAESLRDPETRAKGDRNNIEGKEIAGLRDVFRPAGDECTFTTTWFRSFRYLEIRIRTGSEPLTIRSIDAQETAFPLRRRSRVRIEGNDPHGYRRLDDVTWRTARLCSHETFFDCPHYEQAQFPGDTRVQALYHYVAADEDRLARKAIDDFFTSRTADGLLLSHFPCKNVQLISTYSLYWIGILYDFLLYRGDADFLRPYLPFAREILDWFARRRREDGILGRIEYAPFIDWAHGFRCGNAPQDHEGGSSIVTCLFLHACRWMATLERYAGSPELAPVRERDAAELARAARKTCWDTATGLIADTPRCGSYSVHAQVEAILAGVVPSSRGRGMLRRALGNSEVIQPNSFYYRYYLVQALKRCGMAEQFFAQLAEWTTCLDQTGLTTWPETQNPMTRSDCHGWGVMPGIEYVETVLGIRPDPAKPGFGGIILDPHPGPLQGVRGHVTTPHGRVEVEIAKDDKRIRCRIDSPVPVLPRGRARKLPAGCHELILE